MLESPNVTAIFNLLGCLTLAMTMWLGYKKLSRRIGNRHITKQIKKCGQKPVGFVLTSQILAN